MKTFYKIEEGKLQIGSGELLPESFIEYEVGKEPQELLDTLERESKEQELQGKLDEAQAYLNNTDWYYARKAETGEDVPVEVVEKRLASRKFIQDNKEAK